VTITVFNALGQEVAMLLKQNMSVGHHDVEFRGGSSPSGVYYYRIEAGEFQDAKKMVLMR
jgi:hypothetical protein